MVEALRIPYPSAGNLSLTSLRQEKGAKLLYENSHKFRRAIRTTLINGASVIAVVSLSILLSGCGDSIVTYPYAPYLTARTSEAILSNPACESSTYEVIDVNPTLALEAVNCGFTSEVALVKTLNDNMTPNPASNAFITASAVATTGTHEYGLTEGLKTHKEVFFTVKDGQIVLSSVKEVNTA